MIRRIIWTAAAFASVVIILTALLFPYKGWEKNGTDLIALALVFHFEAHLDEPYAGYRALAHTTFNRAESEDFPDTVRKVVAQGTGPGKHGGCQYSFACDGQPDYPERLCELHPVDTAKRGPMYCLRRWVHSLSLAALMLYVYRGSDPTEGAVLYYSNLVPKPPYWVVDFVEGSVKKIGFHTFGQSKWIGRDVARN